SVEFSALRFMSSARTRLSLKPVTTTVSTGVWPASAARTALEALNAIKVATEAPRQSLARPEIREWNTAPSPTTERRAQVARPAPEFPACLRVTFHPELSDTGVIAGNTRFVTGSNRP